MKNKFMAILLILGIIMIIVGLIIQIINMDKNYKELHKNSYIIKQQNDELWERYDNMCDYSIEQNV